MSELNSNHQTVASDLTAGKQRFNFLLSPFGFSCKDISSFFQTDALPVLFSITINRKSN